MKICTALYLALCAAHNVLLRPAKATETETSCAAVDECLIKLDNGEECDRLPVPERATVSVLPSGTKYTLEELRPGVFSFFDGGYFAVMIGSNNGKHITLIDVPETSMAGGSESLYVQAADEIMYGTEPDDIDIIYSHAHYDHIGGATSFYDIITNKYPDTKIRIFGTTETLEFIQASSSKRAPTPTNIIEKQGRTSSLKSSKSSKALESDTMTDKNNALTLKIEDDLEIQIDIIGGHMHEDLMIYIPRGANDEPAIAMHVDVVFPRWSPWPNLALTQDVRSYLKSIEDILKYDFDVFIPGHLRLGDRTDVQDFEDFVNDLLDAGKKGVATSSFDEFMDAGYGKLFDPTQLEYGNVWYAFVETVRKTQISKCVSTMIEKWGCKVGGLDSTIYSHCFLTVTFAILDE